MTEEYELDKLPSKVESFIKRLDRDTQLRIDEAFDYLRKSPFKHYNPTVIKKLHGKKKGLFRYRIGRIRFIYRVDTPKKLIRILQMDKRGDIY